MPPGIYDRNRKKPEPKLCLYCGKIYKKPSRCSYAVWENSKCCSPECRKKYHIGENHQCYNIPKSKETREKIGNGNRGLKRTKEQRKRQSEYMTGRFVGEDNPFFGHHHTDEQRKKWSENRTGEIPSLETRAKMSKSGKGKIPWNYNLKNCFNEETLKIITENNTGENNGMYNKKQKLESKIKMSMKKTGDKEFVGFRSSIYKIIRTSPEYKQWRNSVFEKDNFTCVDCKDKSGGDFEAHHIIGLSKIIKDNNIKTREDAYKCDLLWDINNGVTVCRKCHQKLHPTLKFIDCQKNVKQ